MGLQLNKIGTHSQLMNRTVKKRGFYMREEKVVQCNGTIYVVQEGDTMYKIAKKFRINLETIMQNNPYLNVFNLKIGDEVCLPLKNIQTIENRYPYVVKSHQTIWDILKEHQISFEDLAKGNTIVKELSLPAGTVLMIDKKNKVAYNLE